MKSILLTELGGSSLRPFAPCPFPANLGETIRPVGHPQGPVKRFVCGLAFCTWMDAVLLNREPTGRCQGVGGLIEPGETEVAAMTRVFERETGIHTPKPPWQWHEFATLTIAKPEGCAHVTFFGAVLTTSEFYDHAGPITDLTGPAVGAYPVSHVVPTARNFEKDLCWLVPLAVRHLQGNGPRRAHFTE